MFLIFLSVIPPSQETTQMTINRLIDKQIMIYLYDGRLVSNKKKWTIDNYNHMDETENYAEWKKAKPKKESTCCMILFT